jgi:selenocysteine lyase/cysteine desulfurase
MIASSLPENASVVTYASEHHANMLPWRRGPATVAYLDCPHSSDESLASLEAHCRLHRGTALVAVTGASNVTGELWPIAELSDIAHRYGARLLVDAAQLAPHAEVDMCKLGIDYLAASGHKLYAPFGAGVLVGPSDWLKLKDPWLMGGGAVEFVTTDSVLWSGLPERQEAGSPNVIGAVALGSALKALSSYGMARLEKDEMAIGDYARERLRTVPGIEVYSLWGSAARRIGVVTFNLAGYDHSLVAAILSAEYGVGVRHGCFCAHPLVVELLGLTVKDAARLRAQLLQGEHPVMPGAVRASIGIGTIRQDVDYLVEALNEIVASGPRWRYSRDARTGDYLPEADPRPWPAMGWPRAAE